MWKQKKKKEKKKKKKNREKECKNVVFCQFASCCNGQYYATSKVVN